MSKPTILQSKISELKKRAGHIAYRSIEIGVDNRIESDLDKRIIKGYLCKWGNRNQFGEKFVKGSCAKSINERGPQSQAKYKITFLWQHDMRDPLATFAVLKEDDYGLYFETNPLDPVPNADRTVLQIRSGTLNQFSIGFYYMWDKIEYDEADDSLMLLEIDFIEGSVVTLGADDETYAIRSGLITEETLHDDIDDFINILPRKDRLEARRLFTLQKSLVVAQNTAERELRQRKPTEKKTSKKINLNYITKNL